jgi:hypothetical protein
MASFAIRASTCAQHQQSSESIKLGHTGEKCIFNSKKKEQVPQRILKIIHKVKANICKKLNANTNNFA